MSNGMLLKVLIVDDDVIMRVKLKSLIDWEQYHYKIVEDASNGCEAMEKLEQYDVDIVITDIRMPNVNGIDLITLINKKYPQIKVIALSAFDDFEYVRQSMKKGAVDYILKHKLDKTYIISILDQTRKRIESEQKREENLLYVKEQFEKSRVMNTHEFILDLVNGRFKDNDTILRRMNQLDLPIKMKNLVVAIVKIDNFLIHTDEKKRILMESVFGLIKDILKDYDESTGVKRNDGSFVIIKSFKNEHSELKIKNQVNSIIQRIRNSVKMYLNITVSVGVCDIPKNMEDIKLCYKEAYSSLKQKFYIGTDCVLKTSEKKIDKKQRRKLENEQINRMIEYLKVGTIQEIEEYINRIYDDLMKADYESNMSICMEFINIGITAAQEYGLSIKNIEHYKMIEKFDNIKSIKTYMKKFFSQIKNGIDSSNILSQYSSYTKKAMEFINLNFHKDISLADVSDHVGLSNQYLSKVFKKDSGMGFIDFLNTRRIESAKQLLNMDDLSLREIVDKVGFNNYNYFIKVFKEKAGVTPFEYKLIKEKDGSVQ